MADNVSNVRGLQIQTVKYFEYKRASEIEWLVEQARNHHYSTFSLYGREEFEQAISGFQQGIKEHFRDPKNVTWVDENVLLVVRKSPSYGNQSQASKE